MVCTNEPQVTHTHKTPQFKLGKIFHSPFHIIYFVNGMMITSKWQKFKTHVTQNWDQCCFKSQPFKWSFNSFTMHPNGTCDLILLLTSILCLHDIN